MNALAKTLHEVRMRRGALELNIPEAVVLCDRDGKACGVEKRERGDSERLIEEFMLIANEAVAETLYRHRMPTVYRVHEDPDPEKLRIFAKQARLFGYRLSDKDLADTHQLQRVLDQTADDPEQQALPTLLLRSLARARYAPECLGHYGLAAKFYLHFTSPIRRYPDLVVHRMLTRMLDGEQGTRELTEFCEDASIQSTVREQAAAELLEYEKAKKELKQQESEIDRRGKVANLFCKAYEKAVLLTATEENVRCWTEGTRMTLEELRDTVKESREIAQMFMSIADIIEQKILPSDWRNTDPTDDTPDEVAA